MRRNYHRVSCTYDGDERVFINWSISRLMQYFEAVRERLPFNYWEE